MHTQAKHLNILSMKAMLCHVERITPGTHNSSIQFGFKFDRVKSVQVIALPIRHQTACKNVVQLSRTPTIDGSGPHTQFVSQVLGDPLCQFQWKKLQKGVVPAVGVLQYFNVSLVAPICGSKDLLLQQHNVQGWSPVKSLARTRQKYEISMEYNRYITSI